MNFYTTLSILLNMYGTGIWGRKITVADFEKSWRRLLLQMLIIRTVPRLHIKTRTKLFVICHSMSFAWPPVPYPILSTTSTVPTTSSTVNTEQRKERTYQKRQQKIWPVLVTRVPWGASSGRRWGRWRWRSRRWWERLSGGRGCPWSRPPGCCSRTAGLQPPSR